MSGVNLTPHVEAPAAEANVTSLVEMAIREKVPVEMLERLVALQERVSERNARSAFFEAVAAFRDECPPILKTRENTQFKVTRNGTQVHAKYAPLEEIDRVAAPVAARCGLVWKWDTRIEGELMHVTCRLTHIAGHSEDTNVSLPYESRAGSSPQQKYASAQTYGMRYSLVAALGITTADEDTDGNAPDAEGEPVLITEEQAADLEALMEEVKADSTRFLKFIGVEKVADIRAENYAAAVLALEQKRAAT